MVRLPQAIDPDMQKAFREMRELLPALFSSEERRRNSDALLSLVGTSVYSANYADRVCNSPCDMESCNGSVHDTDQFYEELADVIISYIYLHFAESSKKTL